MATPWFRRAAAAAVAGPWLAWAIFRTFSLDTEYPLVPIVAFTPYVALTSPVPVLVAAVLRRWGIAALALLASVALIGAVVPRAVSNDLPDGLGADRTLTVMSVNLNDGRAQPRAILELVREYGVDVLSLQELDSGALERLDAAGARHLLPGRAIALKARAGGSGLLASGRVRSERPRDLSGSEQPSGTIAYPGDRQIVVEVVHPPPPTDDEDEQAWSSALDALPATGEGNQLRILAGDFNGTLDHGAVRRVLDRGYTDAADQAGAGLRPTWPADRHRPPITIDHVMVDRRIGVRDFATPEVPGTDHLAVVAELVLPG